ncbi:DeoR/GlpR family DNA-binding transcription regulator [Virgibacillus pantothenticus]|uniref:Lactose phosphotransferase system repressor n=1 Tax=Virgibacillus pantothenticus TaxID=1473 RepID=A0A0L0QU86_VIRPA|nr:DeoR/GlpR family DNA-binding transcription regulator [Virgibacillus pantothenticus]KNE22250.1 DeoR faimly transcriptional regulator [Virgibacillus pantothenticus]MED3735410.1 DeoR/GlpR family DNA-binding transcription regulator [Virgibacillus pantothenticus]QTY16697.1 DeoR/GlpR transcriptional regulator [Virgibacillus pantothenticus]SIT11954.1 transcriptional regulator, DeoR family [Virgibacillus pantothenticus]
MLKDNRQKQIMRLIDEKGFLKVAEASNLLSVAEMTIRRDLMELEELGLIERVHGGAKRKDRERTQYIELSHVQKRALNINEKKHIAKKAAELIEENDVLFIGAGTTTEYIYDYINVDSAKIITNSISVFNRFKGDSRYDLILIGGRLRERTGTFIGYFTRKWMQDIKVQKAFIGTNGIKDEHITTAEEEEGVVQQIILKNSDRNYILADSTKFGVEAFQVLCHIDIIDGIITDNKLAPQFEKYYQNKCNIIK